MTPEREARIRDTAAAFIALMGRGSDADPATSIVDLLAEIDRLRALPVIATCGECRWCHETEVCMHSRAHAEYEIDGCAMPPPSWCPLRGER